MKVHAESTFDKNVLQGLGSFGGMYDNGDSILVAGTDGVGTKLKAAFVMDKHDTVGIDCVAMCANDVVCHGAKPMFFLDYIAMGKLEPTVAADIVAGVAEGCRQAGCALIGGETAEMPGFYDEGEYDMAGFCVGSVDKKNSSMGKTSNRAMCWWGSNPRVFTVTVFRLYALCLKWITLYCRDISNALEIQSAKRF